MFLLKCHGFPVFKNKQVCPPLLNSASIFKFKVLNYLDLTNLWGSDLLFSRIWLTFWQLLQESKLLKYIINSYLFKIGGRASNAKGTYFALISVIFSISPSVFNVVGVRARLVLSFSRYCTNFSAFSVVVEISPSIFKFVGLLYRYVRAFGKIGSGRFFSSISSSSLKDKQSDVERAPKPLDV